MPRIIFLFVLIVLLTACAPNTTIVPMPTVTSSPVVQPTHTATQTPSPTETTIPTPTESAPAIPAFLTELQNSGMDITIADGVAWNPADGRVYGLISPDGTWSEMPNGEAVFNLTNGETLTIPMFNDIEFALEYAVNDVGIWWGNLFAWAQSAETASDREVPRTFKLMKNYPLITGQQVYGDVTLCQSDSPQVCAPIKVEDLILDDGSRLAQIAWRSQSDRNLHRVLIAEGSQEVMDALNGGSVDVPSPK